MSLPLEIVGDASPAIRGKLQRFADAAAAHPWGGVFDGRLVIAQPHLGGLKPTIRRALREWMRPSEFAVWEAEQVGRPVTPGGKVFVANDGVLTAVVFPVIDEGMFLAIAAHEILECASYERARGDRGEDPREANGALLADEYATDRARIDITSGLGWPRSELDQEVGIVPQTDEIVDLLGRPPFDEPPRAEFWQHWVNLARVWAMMAGRADAGAAEEQAELTQWAKHDLTVDDGWSDVRNALRDLYDEPDVSRDRFVELAACHVWDPIEAYGRTAWSES